MADGDDRNWVVVGRFASPYGVKGWLKLYSHTEPMQNIGEYPELWELGVSGSKPLVLEKVQFHGKGLVAKIKGCDDRTMAESHVGCELAIPRGQLPALPEGDYYWSQLEGLSVYNESGCFLGKVDHLVETGANDVMVVKPAAGSVDDRERWLPYVLGHHVLQVDLENQRMLVDWDPDF
ncbi:16S rRNA processing protein [gamma proteobacterium HdN1]|nr:16S rRNA processing protein [gamma proteobacterium HdN1]